MTEQSKHKVVRGPATAELTFGSNKCQCTICERFFTGVRPFDRHLLGLGKRCRTDEEMLAMDLIQNVNGVWMTIPTHETEKVA